MSMPGVYSGDIGIDLQTTAAVVRGGVPGSKIFPNI